MLLHQARGGHEQEQEERPPHAHLPAALARSRHLLGAEGSLREARELQELLIQILAFFV